MDTHCSHKNTDMCFTYDTVYCTDCYQWLEAKACKEEDCVYCPNRPASYPIKERPL